MSNKIKPKLVDQFNIESLNPVSLEFYCLTDEIDKEAMTKQGKKYNPDLAFKSLYFVITSDLRIGIVPDFKFDPWKIKHGIEEKPKSNKATMAIDWFLREIHGIK